MADFSDEEPDFDQNPDDADGPARRGAEFEAELARQTSLLPPELYDTLKPLLVLGSLANHMLLGHPDDPVPEALRELLGYDLDTLMLIMDADDTPSLGRVMAAHTLELFDFVVVSRLVFESALDESLRGYLRLSDTAADDYDGPRQFVLNFGETLLTNIAQYLGGASPDVREELRMRRLQTESIFARLDDTLRPYYPAGHSPAERAADALDAADEAEDQAEAAVHVSFNEGQRVTLHTALRLAYILPELGETPFARALAGVRRFRKKALERLAERLVSSPPDEPVGLAWSELLRLYQAAQVFALSAVTDVLATGSLEDMMARTDEAQPPEQAAAFAHHAREVITALMGGFVEVVEANHPDDAEVAAAKAEISRLAELLLE